MDGTALAIIRHENFSHLTKALFIDANPKVVEALNKRILAARVNGKATAEVGDYENQSGIQRLIATVPQNCLNLVFIDPTDCGIPFATIKLIADQLKNVDFIINMALHTDANRNFVAAVTNPAFSDCREEYERFLGVPNFCARPDVVQKAKHGDFDDLRFLFLEEYRRSLKDQGFIHSEAELVKHYYYVLFASRNAQGLQFWKEITKIRPDNQRTLDLFSN